MLVAKGFLRRPISEGQMLAFTCECLRLIRPYQWVKNLLVFLPMIAAHQFDWRACELSTLAFIGFCFASSSAYCLNDLIDAQSDRQHPRKRMRPLAVGSLNRKNAIFLSAILIFAAYLVCLVVPIGYTIFLTIYVISTLAYSIFFKKQIIIDVVLLADLYTLRVQAGLAANGISETQWFITFNLFFFFFLAVVKRCSELVANRVRGELAISGRGYRVEDLTVLAALGSASGYGSVLIIALYISNPHVVSLYHAPERLWLLCPLIIYWVSRLLIICNRGEMHDDPLVFAITDWVSWLVCSLCALLFWMAM